MKNALFQVLYRSGLVRLFRSHKQRRGVTILLFHDPSPAAMEGALAYLTTHYNIIALDAYVQAHIDGTTAALPEYAAIITFDDGHVGNYALLPVFQKYNVPATIFLCSAIVDTQRHFWFLEAEERLPVEELKRLSNQERLDRLATIGFEEEKEYSSRQALSAHEIEAMRSLFDFQSHTRFHPILTSCRQAQVQASLEGAKQHLEAQFKLRITALAYPNGDYDATTIEETRNAGYRCGLTVDAGFNDATTDLYRLRRLDVNDTENIAEFALKASGLWQYLKSMGRL